MEVKVDPLRLHILEAVECLRVRKCRPDRESIAHYVLRKFGSTMNEIFAELENIVDEGGLMKVEYKGTTSYRNPQSFDTKNSPLLTKHSKILNSSKTTRFILSGINELLGRDPMFLTEGVPLQELKGKLVEFDSSRFTEETTDSLLEREISCGGIRMARSNYLPEPMRVFPKDIPVPAEMQLVVTVNGGGEAATESGKRGRGGGGEELKSPVTTLAGAKKGKKLEEGIQEDAGAPDSSGESTGKKLTKSPARRKIVAEKVAEAVRKSYESTAEFETTSAQMIKLAEAVVAKQVETAESASKGPSLVLASSMLPEDASGQDEHHFSTNGDSNSSPNDVPSDVKPKRGGQRKKQSITAVKSQPKSPEDDDSKLESPTQGSASGRSKRDKRKKNVFDPSDVQPTPQRPAKKPRLSEALPDKPKPTPVKRGRKSVPVTIGIDEVSIAICKGKDKKLDIAALSAELAANRADHDGIQQDTSESKNEARCSHCENPVNNESEVLTCSSCKSIYHRECVNYSEELYNRVIELSKSNNKSWECVQCKQCGICQKKVMFPAPNSPTSRQSANSVKAKADLHIMFCVLCDGGFHVECLGEDAADPSIASSWCCEDCKQKPVRPNTNSGSGVKKAKSRKQLDRSLKDKVESPGSARSKKAGNHNNASQQSPDNSAVPESKDAECGSEKFPKDLRLWSKEDVEKYFMSKGLKDEASLLLRKEVDGYSLLLFQREDIVSGLGLRLGPALKVYRLIHELQSKAPVRPHASWNENQHDDND